MKKFRVLAVVCAVLFLLSAAPVAAFADDQPEYLEHSLWIEGPSAVEKGSTTTYILWCSGYFTDGSFRTYNVNEEFPQDVQFSIVDSGITGPGTSITVEGVLRVDINETDTSITIYGYDLFYNEGRYFEVSVIGNGPVTDPPVVDPPVVDPPVVDPPVVDPPVVDPPVVDPPVADPAPPVADPAPPAPSVPAPPADADGFWLGAHHAIVSGARTIAADGQGYVPYFIFDLLKETGRTVTIQVGNDDFIISARGARRLIDGTSYSFENLAGHSSVTNDDNARGGYTYSLR